MPPTVPCPRCGRPNAPHRVTCMYCGEVMPEPTAPPPAAAPKVAPSPELDKAVKRALLHGDMRQLRKVMAEAAAAPSPPAHERRGGGGENSFGPGTAVADEEPGRAPEQEHVDESRGASGESYVGPSAPVADEGPRGDLEPADLHADLHAAVARADRWDDDPAAAAEALRAAREPLEALLARLEAWEAPPLVLPPFRQAWALAVVPPPEEDRLAELASALEIDVATARQVGLARHPRVALRSTDREDLERRAARYRAHLGLPAAVLAEESLQTQPPARLVLTLRSEGPWRSAWSPSWEPESSTLAALEVREAPPPAPRLVVVGELVFTRYREVHGRRKDDVHLARHGDRRLAVLDLHHDLGVLRVVEGVTRLEGWPGLDPSRSALAFRGLPEVLAARFPGVPVLERCVCRPTRTPVSGVEGRLEAPGWPEWEGHSRTCRVLFGVGS